MRIGIDARELSGRATGVGRYLAGLLREWTNGERARSHEFVLYAPEPLGITLDAHRFATRIIPGTSGPWWEQMRLPSVAAADHLDVFFAPAYTAPLRLDVPTVVTIHDLSYVAHPEWFRLREGARRRWLTRATAARARAIVTVSEFSKREIVERLGVSEAKVRVVPQGIDAPAGVVARRLRADLSAVARSAEAEGAKAGDADPRLLYVGSIFNRRRVPDLIRAVAALARRRSGISLDLVGDNRTFPPQDIDRAIANHGMTGRVRWHRYATEVALRDLYARARAFAFLSEYEGLGMTPLEALAVGIPPVVVDTPAARESLEHAAMYVPINGDVPAVALALETALFDERARARVLDAAPAALAKYEWPHAARETLAVLERA
jgi:glycosyltransferase involved in cell wall biosynthesis